MNCQMHNTFLTNGLLSDVVSFIVYKGKVTIKLQKYFRIISE